MKITVPKFESKNEYAVEIVSKSLGEINVLILPITIEVEEYSFLHIGASSPLLTGTKGAVFKVDRIPVIPASSFKGALRSQLEMLFSTEISSLLPMFNVPEGRKDSFKPCIPTTQKSDAEQQLHQYREKHCYIQVKENKTEMTREGLCPVCYFMGAAGIMGCIRIPNFFPEAHQGSIIANQTSIRIDRGTGTTVDKAKVEFEQVKPGIMFTGTIEIVNSSPTGLEFGQPRKIHEMILDRWLETWRETNQETRKQLLLERILIPALHNVRRLGGHKSKGGGKVLVTVNAS